jgi:site-specific recombinase XerD
MTPIAPHITAFFRERLPLQLGASPHTCESYAYTFQLLLVFASDRLKVTPSKLHLEQIDALLVMDFLAHIEAALDNSSRTRNARLTAIKSFMRFVEHRVPSVNQMPNRHFRLRRPRNTHRLHRCDRDPDAFTIGKHQGE